MKFKSFVEQNGQLIALFVFLLIAIIHSMRYYQLTILGCDIVAIRIVIQYRLFTACCVLLWLNYNIVIKSS